MSKTTSVLAGALLLVALAGPASAGGTLLDFDQGYYVPGEVVRGSSGVWLKSSMGRLSDGPYFAYLSELTKRMPPPLPPDALRVAPLRVEQRPTGEYGEASVEFMLPAVAPGRYWLTICNAPCTLPLGDLMATPLLVAASDDEGRLAVLREDLIERIRAVRIRLDDNVLGERGDSLRSRTRALERDVTSLVAEVRQLRAEADRPARPAEEDDSSALPSLLAFALPAAALGIAAGRRSRRPRSA